jgi:glucose/arabinose dehydrogenase
MKTSPTSARCALSLAMGVLFGMATVDVAAVEPRVVATGLAQPVGVAGARGDARLFVVLKGGTIVTVANGSATEYLNIVPLVASDNERGLLGLAFDAAYRTNGRFYVYYIDRNNGDSVVARFRAQPPSAATVDPASRQEIIRIPQEPFPNHKAGWIGFRPGDAANLYIALGDGGAGYDPNNNAQNLRTLLGKMLRVDVSGSGAGYTVPADNPYAGNPNARPEIWAAGLRNPWRNSFDRKTGDFWIGDVGQDTREEINFEPAGTPGGRNYGWRLREGSIQTPGGVGGNAPGLTGPVFDYPHSGPGALGASVTGGYVYRGPSIAELDGRYVFGDFASNRVFSSSVGGAGQLLDVREDTSAVLAGTGVSGIASFGEDSRGRLYVVGINGVVAVLCPSPAAAAEDVTDVAASSVVARNPCR